MYGVHINLASDGGLTRLDSLNEPCVFCHRGNTGAGDGEFDSCFQHWPTTSMYLCGEGGVWEAKIGYNTEERKRETHKGGTVKYNV